MAQADIKQRGSAHVVIIICLVIALITALGWIFWQNFVHKEATKKDTELVVVKKHDTATNDSITEPSSTQFSQADLSKANDVVKNVNDCSVNSGTHSNVLILSDREYINDQSQVVLSSGKIQSLGDSSVSKYIGAVNDKNTWLLLTGGCGSQASFFILKKDNSAWKLIQESGNNIFDCSTIDGTSISSDGFLKKCYDFKADKERDIK